MNILPIEEVNTAFTKIIRFKSAIPRFTSREEILSMVNMKPSIIIERIINNQIG